MASQTLSEAAKLINNQVIQGVVEDVITTNPIFNFLPFKGYTGQAIVVNREDALGDAGFYAVGATITHKGAATFTQYSYSAVSLIGDVEMNGLVQAQSQSAGTNQTAIEISSKSKRCGRLFQNGMVSGTGVSPDMHSLHTLVDSNQYTTPSAGQAVSFTLLRTLKDLVKSKDGQVDWLMAPGRTLRSIQALYDALGGTTPMHVIELTSGQKQSVLLFEGTPVFQNDWMPVTETANGAALTGGALNSIYAGVWDDGSGKIGVSGIHPESVPAGIVVEYVGKQEDKDNDQYRVKWYTNFVSMNRKGIARLTSINN